MELHKGIKLKQIFVLAVSIVFLLTIPLIGDIYHKTLYYSGMILVIPLLIHRTFWHEKYEERFYNRWRKHREQRLIINVVRESIKGFVIILVTVIISQFIGNNRTPIEIINNLPLGLLVWLILLILVFGLALGIAAWHGNEKKYCRMYFEKKR